MPRYAESMLADGERITFRTRQHWLATIIDGRKPWLLLVGSLILLFLSQSVSGLVRDLIGYLVLAGVVISLAWLAWIYLTWWSQDYIVTNRRVLKVEGVINKRTSESSLEKINDAVLEQNLVARILNYGDLDILTAADAAIDRYRMLDRAPQFKRTMLNQKHLLENEFSRSMPTPPLRASATPSSPAATPTEPVATSPSPSPSVGELAAAAMAQQRMEPLAASGPTGVASGPPSATRMTADDIARAIATLADLRDRGAITPEDYERKKDELLSRL